MPRISTKALKAARQQKVEQLNLRGLTQREIVRALEKQRVINPISGKPWSLATINSDLQELEEKWQSAALVDRAAKKARVNAEIQELKRAAWADKDLKLALDLLKVEIDLFSLTDPITVNHQVGGNVDVNHRLDPGPDVSEMEADEVDMLIQNLLLAARVGERPVIIEGVFGEAGGMEPE